MLHTDRKRRIRGVMHLEVGASMLLLISSITASVLSKSCGFETTWTLKVLKQYLMPALPYLPYVLCKNAHAIPPVPSTTSNRSRKTLHQ